MGFWGRKQYGERVIVKYNLHYVYFAVTESERANIQYHHAASFAKMVFNLFGSVHNVYHSR